MPKDDVQQSGRLPPSACLYHGSLAQVPLNLQVLHLEVPALLHVQLAVTTEVISTITPVAL